MISRRSLVIGASCLVAGGAAYAMTPRQRLSLVGSAQLEELVPTAFEEWTSQDVSDPLAINSPESLSNKLYSQLVARLYSNAATGNQVMMLLAYGARQTDGLQLHRPEVCYPAFGYKLTRNEPTSIELASSVTLPARRLAAEVPGRQESIVYWSRIGEDLPIDGAQQRGDRLKLAFKGLIPDGVLVRFSTLSIEPGGGWDELERFVVGLVTAVPADKRQALIGTARARSMQSVAA